MSTLLIDELFDGVTFEQDLKIDRAVNLIHFRPWIYKQGTIVDGQLTCDVYQGASLIASSTIDFSEINSGIPGAYAHGMIRFDFVSLYLGIAEGNTEEEYTFKIYMDNHTTDTNNFIGICRDFENPRYPRYGFIDMAGDPINDSVESSGLELYIYEVI